MQNPARKRRQDGRQLHFALEQSTDGIAIADLEPKIVYANTAFARMHGYSPEEVIGLKVSKLHNHRQMGKYRTRLAQVKRHGYWAGGMDCIKKDGAVFPAYMSLTLLKEDHGSAVGILAVISNISRRKQAEEHLQQSELNLCTLFNTISDFLFVLDEKGTITEVNTAVTERLGYSREELIGRGVGMVHPTEAGKEAAAILEDIRQDKRNYCSLPLVTKGGEQIPVETKVTKGVWSGKEVLFGISRDITQRKEAEEAVKRSRETLQDILRSSPNAITVTDLKGRITECNEETLRLHGFSSKSDLVGKSAFAFFPARELERARANLEKTLKKGGVKNIEYTALTRQGREFPIELSANVIKDSSGQPVGFVAITKDVTERKRMEESLLFKTTLLEAQFETSIDGILVVDHRGKCIFYNERFCRMWGLPADLLETKDDERIRKYAAGALKYPDLFEEEVKYLYSHRDEKSRDVLEFKDGRVFDRYSSPLMDSDGNYHGRIWYFHDVTDQKRTETKLLHYQRRLQSLVFELETTESRERKRIAAELHDGILQQLIFTKMRIDRLRASGKSSQLSMSLQEITETLDRTIQETQNLTCDLGSPTLYELGLNSALAEWLTEEIEQKHQIATTLKDAGAADLVRDEVAAFVLRAVRELSINAVKHARPKNIKVTLRRKGQQVEVCVADDGAGFHPEDLNLPKDRPGGYGLFSIKERVHHMGGSFDIRSRPQEGTEVRLTVPLYAKHFVSGGDKHAD